MRTIDYQGQRYDVSDAHRAADVMPWHTDRPEFAELVQDLRASGFDPARPVHRHRTTGLLIDGRRRELAARVAGVEPVYLDVDWGDAEVVAFVRREHNRRNLFPSERAAAAVELAELLPEGRPGATPQRCGVSAAESAEVQPESVQRCTVPRSAAEIAADIGVSERTVKDAAKVKTHAPDLLPSVREGKLPAHTAAKVANLPADERQRIVAAADPKAAAKLALSQQPPPATTGPVQAPSDAPGAVSTRSSGPSDWRSTLVEDMGIPNPFVVQCIKRRREFATAGEVADAWAAGDRIGLDHRPRDVEMIAAALARVRGDAPPEPLSAPPTPPPAPRAAVPRRQPADPKPAFDPPGPGLDAVGTPIPDRLRDLFADTYLARTAADLEAAATGLESVSAWNAWLKPVYHDLRRHAEHLRGVRPYAVCSNCGGRQGGCPLCVTAGFLPEHMKHAETLRAA